MLKSQRRESKFWKGRSRESEILERSELESDILSPTPQPWFSDVSSRGWANRWYNVVWY